jgi:glutamate 5-kinase
MDPDPVRQQILNAAHTVVVKVGTNVLAGADGALDETRLQSLADQLHAVRRASRKLVLVSSGAIGAGVGRLGLGRRPTGLRQLQACAAVGQGFLMRAYQDCLGRHGVQAAQVLLTAGDFDSRLRYLNARNTILTLLEWDCLPIINENDTVSVAEIRFGDNDHLAALVTNLLQAPLLILLSVVDGLFSADPRTDPGASLLSVVRTLDDNVLAMAGASQSALGTGGMRSKLRAAKLVTGAGEAVVLANGTRPGVLASVLGGEAIGTFFLPRGDAMPAWKRWLGFAARPKGRLVVDAGASRAVRYEGGSLLPIGVLRVEGLFGKGDVVDLCNADATEFARGLSNYSSSVAERIRGLRTEQIEAVLAVLPYEELVHRDNLVLTGENAGSSGAHLGTS